MARGLVHASNMRRGCPTHCSPTGSSTRLDDAGIGAAAAGLARAASAVAGAGEARGLAAAACWGEGAAAASGLPNSASASMPGDAGLMGPEPASGLRSGDASGLDSAEVLATKPSACGCPSADVAGEPEGALLAALGGLPVDLRGQAHSGQTSNAEQRFMPLCLPFGRQAAHTSMAILNTAQNTAHLALVGAAAAVPGMAASGSAGPASAMGISARRLGPPRPRCARCAATNSSAPTSLLAAVAAAAPALAAAARLVGAGGVDAACCGIGSSPSSWRPPAPAGAPPPDGAKAAEGRVGVGAKRWGGLLMEAGVRWGPGVKPPTAAVWSKGMVSLIGGRAASEHSPRPMDRQLEDGQCTLQSSPERLQAACHIPPNMLD